MKQKLTILTAILLLAVGWANTASAQLKTASPVSRYMPAASFNKMQKKTHVNKTLPKDISAPVKAQQNSNAMLSDPSLSDTFLPDLVNVPMMRAPKRATYNETSDAIRDFAFYDAITYDWIDGDGESHTSKITEAANNPYQMAYLVGNTYLNPDLPGIKYSAFYDTDHPYYGIDFGWDIPSNARWPYEGINPIQTGQNIYISAAMTNSNDDISHALIYSITVSSGNTTIISWSYNNNGTSLPTGMSASGFGLTQAGNNVYLYPTSTSNQIIISGEILSNYTNLTVTIRGYHYNFNSDAGYARFYVNDESLGNLSSSNANYSTSITNSLVTKYSITPPTYNGYTVFLVKVKDGTSVQNSETTVPAYRTYTWEDVVNNFDTYFESIELLTNSARVGGTTSNAGTVFSYTGSLNRFFFISKGKDCYLSSYETSINVDLPPFYGMYEEFSPTTTNEGDEITDFFEKMDQGAAYDVVHDCRSVNVQEHYFSMTGKNGTTHNSMSNLVFYIPDDRGQYYDGTNDTWRNYDHQPRVGLYTAELEATATPNKTQEHVYDVTINWETSLQTILGFDEPETHDLWVVVKDDQGNVVLDSLLTTTTDTTYTYQVPQYPESYTIDYIVRAWPTAAPTPIDHDANSAGTFFADSDPDDVLIPGYKDFISIVRHHYESDFDIDEEYNYYRNFMSLGNQNGTAGLTTARIDRGENVLHLFRYDYDKPTPETEAATLTFTHEGNQVNWNVVYNDQWYYPKHTGGESKYYLSTMKIPTSGSFTVGSNGGSGTTTTKDVTFTAASSATNTLTNDDVTITNGSTELGGYSAMYLYGSPTISTATGTITKIVFNGSNSTHYPVSRLSTTTGNYTYSNNVGTWTGNASSVTFSASGDVGCSSIVVTVETTSGGSGSTVSYDTTYVLVDSLSFYYDYDAVSAGSTFTVNDGNWSSSTNALYMNDSRFAYIRNYTTNAWENYLTYTVPADYSSNETLGFDVYVGSVSYSNYLGCDINGGNFAAIVNTTGSNQYYTLWVTGLKAGDKVNFYGATPSSESGYYNNYQSPNIADIMVYRQQVTEVSGEDLPINVSGIQLVDQFRASTAEDKHPYRYGYRLQYTGQNTAEWDTTKVSNVLIVPVKHSGSTLNGFYTFDQMIHDSIPELLEENVKNGDLTMTLGGDAEIFYYTINRRPDTGSEWDRMSYMQFDNNHTFYTEGVNYLPQYYGSTAYPGDIIERLDNADVITGSYDSYMKYGPVVWTFGYDRFYYDTEGLPAGLTADGYHNSYGAPVWKTGVGDVNITSLRVERQTKTNGQDNPSVMWTDANGAECNLFFLGVTADGILPTTNMKGEGGTNYYEPYMFRVWVKSNSGALRGYTPISTSTSDYLVNSTDYDPNMMVVYEEYTNSSTLDKAIPSNYSNSRNIIKFGALKDVKAEDLEVIVRFYYKVKHLNAVDDSQDNMVTLDFVNNEWQIPTGNTSNWQTEATDFTANDYTIGLANKYYYNEAVGFLMLGSNGELTLPAFDRKVKQIQVVGRPGASNSVKMNIFVGNDAASSEVTGSTGTSIFDIAEAYQTIGTQYTLKVTNNYNAQIVQVIVIFEDEQPSGMMLRAPKREGETTQYVKVTSADQIVAGKKYIAVDETQNLAMGSLKSTSGNTFANAVGVTINNGTIDIDGTDVMALTLAEVGTKSIYSSEAGSNVTVTTYSLQMPSGRYLGWGGSSNSTYFRSNSSATDNYLWFYGPDHMSSKVNNFYLAEAPTRIIGTGTDNAGSPRFGAYVASNAVLYVESEGTTPVTNPELTAPVDGSTVNVGTNTGNGVSVPVTISGSDLSEDLTVSVSGTGFSVSAASVTADAANAGTSVIVTYNGTDANATGTLTISSGEVSVTVNLTASYDGGTTPPAGDEPELIAPVDGSTVYVGTITAEGESVSVEIPVSGNNLTKDLTATLTGTGFSFLTRAMTIPYADVNAGTATVTVVYNGTDENATGRLTLSSDEVIAIVNLTASFRLPVVLTDTPAGYVVQDSRVPEEIPTGIIETLFDQQPNQVVSVTYVNSLGMQSDKPFDGINIVVTRYSDGTMRTSKALF